MNEADVVERTGTTRMSGIRVRLLIALLAIGAFVISAAAAGLYAFREVGSRLDTVGEHVPRAVAAVGISRAVERLVAAVPVLLSAPDPIRRRESAMTLEREMAYLEATLAAPPVVGTAPPGFVEARSLLPSLAASLDRLGSLVERRAATERRLSVLRRTLLRANADLDRLLAPWLAITDEEMAALVRRARAQPVNREGEASAALAALVERQRSVQLARRQVASAVELLVEAVGVERLDRLAVLDFQLGLAIDDLAATAERLDARLRPLFLERVEALRALAAGTASIADARTRALRLGEEAETVAAAATALSARLGTIVERDAIGAGRDVEAAVGDALRVQQTNARVLVLLVVMALSSAVLITWLYVGRRVVRPLGALADATVAIAGGRLDERVAVGGDEEIAAMGRAVETFRRNTLERDALLVERSLTAERLEREVRERTAELEAADAFKSRFLTAASHDLRQPLHALNLLLAQLDDETSPVERDRLTRRIVAAVGSMNGMCDTLLDMARLESGVLEPRLERFPIATLLAHVETMFADAADAAGLRLRVVSSDAWVHGDALLLERLVANLVANAVRHTRRGSVLVGCRRRGEHLRIDVRDSGPGIAPEHHVAVFDEFRRLSSDESERGAGLGFGLAIVRRLAALLDCPVTLRSEVGRGTCFSVSVPLAGVVRRDEAVPSLPHLSSIDPLPGRLVVIVDDDEAVLEATGGLLRRWGCDVLSAASVDTAIARLRDTGRPADLLICDSQLAGGRNGIEAVSRLRQATRPDLPAFLISGDTSSLLRDEARAQGLPLLHKPLVPMTLRTVSSNLLRTFAPAPAPASALAGANAGAALRHRDRLTASPCPPDPRSRR